MKGARFAHWAVIPATLKRCPPRINAGWDGRNLTPTEHTYRAASIVPPGLCNFRFRLPALCFAACRANYNRASGADVLEAGGYRLGARRGERPNEKCHIPCARADGRQVAKHVCRAQHATTPARENGALGAPVLCPYGCKIHRKGCRVEKEQRPAVTKAKAPIPRTIVPRRRRGEGLRAERGGSARKPVVLGESLILWRRRWHLVGTGIRRRRWQRRLPWSLEPSNPDGRAALFHGVIRRYLK